MRKKKKVIRVLAFLWKISIPLISAVVGLELVEKFNILQALNIITDVDKAFDTCTTVYFAIVNVVLLSIAEWIKSTFFPTQSIRVIFSKPNEVVQDSNIPILILKNDFPCEARITVRINARKKTCKGLKLTVECVNFATMQLPTASTVATVDEKGNYIIDLEMLFGNQEYANTEQTFRILFSREPANGTCQSEMYSKITKEPFLLDFDSNNMILRAE